MASGAEIVACELYVTHALGPPTAAREGDRERLDVVHKGELILRMVTSGAEDGITDVTLRTPGGPKRFRTDLADEANRRGLVGEVADKYAYKPREVLLDGGSVTRWLVGLALGAVVFYLARIAAVTSPGRDEVEPWAARVRQVAAVVGPDDALSMLLGSLVAQPPAAFLALEVAPFARTVRVGWV